MLIWLLLIAIGLAVGLLIAWIAYVLWLDKH